MIFFSPRCRCVDELFHNLPVCPCSLPPFALHTTVSHPPRYLQPASLAGSLFCTSHWTRTATQLIVLRGLLSLPCSRFFSVLSTFCFPPPFPFSFLTLWVLLFDGRRIYHDLPELNPHPILLLPLSSLSYITCLLRSSFLRFSRVCLVLTSCVSIRLSYPYPVPRACTKYAPAHPSFDHLSRPSACMHACFDTSAYNQTRHSEVELKGISRRS